MSGDWNGAVNPYCHPCIYYGKSTCTCDYILIVGHPRPCPAGAGCTARILKKDVKKKMGKPRWDIAKGKQMWEQGMSDSQIAKHFGIAANTVLHQRRSYWEKGVTMARLRDSERFAGTLAQTEDNVAFKVLEPTVVRIRKHA